MVEMEKQVEEIDNGVGSLISQLYAKADRVHVHKYGQTHYVVTLENQTSLSSFEPAGSFTGKTLSEVIEQALK